jgi:hypothetical protein
MLFIPSGYGILSFFSPIMVLIYTLKGVELWYEIPTSGSLQCRLGPV